MVNEEPIRQILEGIRQGDQHAEDALFRRLHRVSEKAVPGMHWQEGEMEDLFLDAFIAFLERVRKRRFSILDDTKEPDAEQMLHRAFDRVFSKLAFHLDRSAYRTVEGVKAGNEHAKAQLAIFLVEKGYFLNFARQQMEQFEVRAKEAEDFLKEAFLDLLDKIKKGEFSLEASDPNELGKNKLGKYFKQIIVNKISKWKRKRGEDISEEVQKALRQVDAEYPPTVQVHASDTLQWKMMLITSEMGEPCKTILYRTYYYGETPKTIAKSQFHPDYTTTEEVRAKKMDCLRRLHRDFVHQMEALDRREVEQIAQIAQQVVAHLDEPCRTILVHYLAPEKVSMGEIAEILQRTRPIEEAGSLATAEQVKRRRFKCMAPLYDQIWETVFSTTKSA